MQQSAKQFSEQLSQCLDDLGLPSNTRERASILSKMLDISKQQAWSILDGHTLPDNELLQRIAYELEVDPAVFNKK